MLLRITKEILSYSPFFAPDMNRFYKNNYRLPNKFNKIPYPFLSLGRLLLSILVVYALIIISLGNPSYKEIIDREIINKNLVTPTKKPLPVDSNINPIQSQLDNISNTIKNEVDFAIESTKITTSRYILGELFYGHLGLIIRVLLVYLVYSFLFYLFGNRISQRERKARTNMVDMTKIGQIILNKPELLLDNSQLIVLDKEFKNYNQEQKLYNKDYQNRILSFLNTKK